MKTLFYSAIVALLLSPAALRAQSAPANEISASLGVCSAAFNVTTADTRPIYGAKVDTHIQYGLMGMKKLDLEAYTDANGHLTITQLPLTLKKPLYIHISKDGKEQIVEFHPEKSCQAKFDVVLY